MKKVIKKVIRLVGFEDHRKVKKAPIPGSPERPIGKIGFFLEDIRARGFCPNLILDIGANRGAWTIKAKKIFPEAAILMVEPQPEMRAFLDSICSKYKNIQWVEAGAGASEGTLVQTIWKDLAGSSFLPTVREDLLASGKQREVKICTIDSLLKDKGLNVPELVKLDIQGFELEALRGAESLFGKTEVFILETSLYSFMDGQPLIREVISFMGDRGYEVYDITGFLRRPLDGALGQVDLAFVRNKGILRNSNKWSNLDIYGTSEGV